MAVRIAEIRAPAAAVAVDLARLLACGVSEVGDAEVPDAGESRIEFVVADQERVVVCAKSSCWS